MFDVDIVNDLVSRSLVIVQLDVLYVLLTSLTTLQLHACAKDGRDGAYNLSMISTMVRLV